ncbi:hypothetical protein [Streptomyces sp. Tue6028]|uniref:hypothetical protein n=1 Tax=Streptomyces sp. Tue6028 TaxID=2036037 RepID=UPI003EB9953A
MTTQHNVYVPEGTFGVLDSGEIPVQTADWANGLAAPMSEGVLIVTGIHTGHIRLAAQALTCPPATLSDDIWEEVVEVSVHASTDRLQIESLEQGPVQGLPFLSPAGPGWYRLRVHAEGRNVLSDQVSTEPVEDYLVITWPAPATDAVVLRSSARIEQALTQAHGTPKTSAPLPARTKEQEALRQRLQRK